MAAGPGRRRRRPGGGAGDPLLVRLDPSRRRASRAATMGLYRVLLALWVVVNHGQALFGRGVPEPWVAVQAFFIISGFYMSLVLHERYTGPGSTRRFLANRFLRLFPAYWVVLAVTVIVVAVAHVVFAVDLLPLRSWREWSSLLGWHNVPLLVVANTVVFGQNEILFLGMDSVTGALYWTQNFDASQPKVWRFLFVPQVWSVELELLFYLMAPWLLRRRLRVILSIVGASLALRLWLVWGAGLGFDPWTYRFFPTELALFLLGHLAYRLLRAPWWPRVAASRWARVAPPLLLVVTVIFPFVPWPGPWKAWPYYALVTATIPLLFAWTRDWSWDRAIGELSYPIYIVHYLVVLVCREALPDAWQSHRSLVAAAVSIVLAWLLVKTVVEPVERLRQRQRQDQRPVVHDEAPGPGRQPAGTG